MDGCRRIRSTAVIGALAACLATAAFTGPPLAAVSQGTTAPTHAVSQGTTAPIDAAAQGTTASTDAEAPAAVATESGHHSAGSSYTNFVTRGYSIDFPDPAVMRGKDGRWYAYSTGGPYDEANERGSAYKIASSADLVHWEDEGSVFDATHRPSWAAPTTGFWAPDIRYLNGQYLLYFTVPDTTTTTQGFDPAIGVATADTPAGPWTPSDKPLIPAEPRGNGFDTVIDPAMFTDTDGTHYLYWGGYGTGIWMVELSPDGLRAVSEPKHIAASRYEGPNVVKHGDHYYLFASSANCCAGPTTGYTVFVGRSTSPAGPFVDKLGKPLLASRAGGTPVIAPNGNTWIGTGHHSAALDVSGEMYMAYHAIDRNDPWLDVSPGFTMRPMNIDRLDWIDGWPIVRAGRGGSDTPQPAPVVRGEVDDRFEDPDATADHFRTLHGSLTVAGPDDRSDSGRFAQLAGDAALAVTKPLARTDVRIEADVRTAESGIGSAGVLARADGDGIGVRAILDAGANELRLEAGQGPDARTKAVPLPAGFDATAWHVLALEARGTRVTADITDARLGDPWAKVSLDVPRGLDRSGRAGLVGANGGEADNFSATGLFTPVTKAVPDPEPGKVAAAYSDDFADGLGTGWSWLREDPEAAVSDGALVWPTQTADLVGGGTPGLLLRESMPDGDYMVETKLDLDLGEDTVRNFQQAGLIAYVGDDDFLRFDVVAVGPTRIAEFGKETVFQGRRSWGGGLAGAPGETTWLRLLHTLDPDTREHRFRAGSSTDGVHWTWGLTWTLPADSTPKVGLVSQGSQPATTEEFGPATAVFDYFRVSRP
ncbi:family 43 glycosylhydrolase [Actinopolymorpha sp. B17G11]|uniref:family 43 glycosylhydrolase n=1 Tax=Actinopolymorpha sp. B17G11 TaxID=3160861 RepID=UPI0032E4BD95